LPGFSGRGDFFADYEKPKTKNGGIFKKIIKNLKKFDLEHIFITKKY